MTQQPETMSREIATQEAPRRQRKDREIEPAEQPRRQQILTPNALSIATQIDELTRERSDAIAERNLCNARIEQFESRVKELIREKQMLEMRLADAQRETEIERNERIRLADAMESIIHLASQKLTQPILTTNTSSDIDNALKILSGKEERQ